MHQHDPKNYQPLTRLASPLLFKKSPLTHVVLAFAVETLTVPPFVSMPTPGAMPMEPPKPDTPTPDARCHP